MATVRWQLEWPWLRPRLRAEEKMVAWWSMKNVSNLFFLSRFLISNLCTTLLVSYLDCRLIPHLLSPIIAMCYCELYYSTSLTWPWLKYIILKSNMDLYFIVVMPPTEKNQEKSRRKIRTCTPMRTSTGMPFGCTLNVKEISFWRVGLDVSKVTAQWFETSHLLSITGSPPRHRVRTCNKPLMYGHPIWVRTLWDEE